METPATLGRPADVIGGHGISLVITGLTTKLETRTFLFGSRAWWCMGVFTLTISIPAGVGVCQYMIL